MKYKRVIQSSVAALISLGASLYGVEPAVEIDGKSEWTLMEGERKDVIIKVTDDLADYGRLQVRLDAFKLKDIYHKDLVSGVPVVIRNPFAQLGPGKHILSVTYKSAKKIGSQTVEKHDKLQVTIEDEQNIDLSFPEHSKLYMGEVPQEATRDHGGSLNNEYFMIRSDKASSSGLYPLFIYLHGSGDSARIAKFSARSTIPEELNARGHEFIFCQPYSSSKKKSTDLQVLLKEIIDDHPIDKTRVYLTGFSRGAHSAWDWLKEHSHEFAAVALSGAYLKPSDAQDFEELILKERSLGALPVMTYYGSRDKWEPKKVTEDVVNILNSQRDCNAWYVLLDGANHAGSSRLLTYGSKFRNNKNLQGYPDMIDFLFEHQKNQKASLEVIDFPEVIDFGSKAEFKIKSHDPDGKVDYIKIKRDDVDHMEKISIYLNPMPMISVSGVFNHLMPGEHPLQFVAKDSRGDFTVLRKRLTVR